MPIIASIALIAVGVLVLLLFDLGGGVTRFAGPILIVAGLGGLLYAVGRRRGGSRTVSEPRGGMEDRR